MRLLTASAVHLPAAAAPLLLQLLLATNLLLLQRLLGLRLAR